VLRTLEPEFVFHLAAQPLVRKSYQDPLETIDTNILGTANLLEAIRVVGKPTVVVVITSDKCYENRDWEYGYRETEPMGGADVYSMSKGAAELVLSSYRRSFFDPADIAKHGIRLASARAGNVVGGGDWAADRIVPDLARAVMTGEVLTVRNPQSVRPWQHVLEPLGGYLLLAERMAQASDELAMLCEGWNFGPQYEGEKTVQDVVMTLLGEIGKGNWRNGTDSNAPAEAKQLRLSIEKAMSRLHWTPRWDFRETMAKTAEWYKAYFAGSEASLRDLTLRQIDEYMQTSDK
jgi:CDP-glucose 4,6-dehydratase